MSAPTLGPAGQAWRCDVCHRSSMWTNEHMWYGSWREVDDGQWDRIVVICSLGCREIAEVQNFVPHDAAVIT